MSTLPVLAQPGLPYAQGPISAEVIERLGGRAPHNHLEPVWVPLRDADPFGLDVQLALYICYELHYRGFAGVDADWEWNAGLLHLRSQFERIFLAAVRREVGSIDPEADTAEREMARLSTEPADGSGPSYHLRDAGTWTQMREYFIHRSLYHLKEGDPHAWLIPRLGGQAKAAFVAVEFDEYGAGSAARVHQQLFADLMAAADLDPSYLGYLDAVPAESLAIVNLMSMFGLHRRLRGAAAGHFAATEITSSPGSQRMVTALQRLDAPEACVRFYREHVEADAVHEQVVRHDVVGDLVQREPGLDADVVFGMRAFGVMEDRLANHLMTCWRDGRSSLCRPLP
ncbi:iron-containing redox enzyme family protein [Mycobacterium sp. TNTM28]|uniref:Iron-containing redox enzyme family protein n=1 Tax=[Mycobacterium] fortunisiensis TaxID=2600579 RepID=A0ABS6KK92_9MYCO|nr:iron-containing redox enzyme family protein [[Mycobacterium] fortunisiensis]MBU9763979.1 iron-containing redox enzyme family protein [[Mycobacterium] fortunisiensis]